MGLINPRARPCDEQVIRSSRGSADCTARERRWVLATAILASVITYIDESVVNVALPAIAKDLASSVAVIQWVINAYTLCLAAFLLVGGAAGDQIDRRRVFVVGIAIFATASVWCGLSPNVTLSFPKISSGRGSHGMRATMARMLGWSAELGFAAAVLLRAKYSLSALVTSASMSAAGTRTIALIGGVASPRRSGCELFPISAWRVQFERSGERRVAFRR